MNPFTASLSLLQITVGASSLIAPAFWVELFGCIPQSATTYVARLTGSRDLMLGVSIWISPADNAQARRSLVFLANAVNAIDILSGLMSFAEGDANSEGVLWSTAAAAVGLALGLISLRFVAMSDAQPSVVTIDTLAAGRTTRCAERNARKSHAISHLCHAVSTMP